MSAPPPPPTSLTPFQATYHWRNKDCTAWSAQWFKRELPGTEVTGEGSERAVIGEVGSVEGDVDLGQRKGKLLTIYDCRIEMNWSGTTRDGQEVSGKLTIPEVSHECIDGLSEYQFDWTPSPSDPTYYAFLRSAFPPVLRAKLDSFRPALVAAHGNDSASASAGASAAVSGSSTPGVPARYSPAPPGEVRKAAPAPAPAPAAASSSGGASAGSSTAKPAASAKAAPPSTSVRIETRLQASASDIWALLTDPARIPMWARSAAKMSTTAEEPYELFGGNVIGKIISAQKDTQLVQTWQLRGQWPAEHFGTMTISLDQGSDSTGVVFDLAGVPIGQEETIEKALDTYYVRGLKQMGLVREVSSRIVRREAMATQTERAARGEKQKAKATRKRKVPPGAQGVPWSTVGGWAVVGGLVALLGGIVWSTMRG